MGTFDDNRRHHRITEDSFRRVKFALDPPVGDMGLLSRSSGFRSCQRIPHGCNTIATRRTTSRSPVWSSGCALNYPKMELGLSGGLDSTHALIVAARDGSRRPTAQRSALSILITTSIGAPSP
jgi:NAD+ synthase (glutamine-hydrolysing)